MSSFSTKVTSFLFNKPFFTNPNTLTKGAHSAAKAGASSKAAAAKANAVTKAKRDVKIKKNRGLLSITLITYKRTPLYIVLQTHRQKI